MASKFLLASLMFLSLVGCGFCWRGFARDFPGARREWPPMPVPGFDVEENPVVCEVCTIVVGELQNLLGNDSKKIISLLDEICKELPSPFNDTCKEYVDEWTPIIIDFLENQTPKEVCTILTFCDEVEPVEPQAVRGLGHFIRSFRKTFRTNINKLMIKKALGNQFVCEGCDQVVQFLHDALTNQMMLNEIVTLLEEGCVIWPDETPCRNFFENLPAEIKAFADEYLNNRTCKALGLCLTSGLDSPIHTFHRIFTGILPVDFDWDIFPKEPRPDMRPRPDTEPPTRPHPSRGNFRPFKPNHHDHDHGKHNHSRPAGHDHHYPHRDHGRWPHPPRHRPHSGGHDHDHRPHHGPRHGYRVHDFPLPDFRPWWRPAMKPFNPLPPDAKPTLPEEPMATEKPSPTEVPEDDTPEPPVLPVQPVARVANLDPRNRQEGRFLPREDGLWKPGYENRKGVAPAKPYKHRGMNKANRKQRSVLINTVINTKDFDETDTFEVDPVDEQVESGWQCDVCEYEVEILQTYLKENEDVIVQKLMTIADMFCERLPVSTTAECKTEMANILPPIVNKIIVDYLTAENVCTALKVC